MKDRKVEVKFKDNLFRVAIEGESRKNYRNLLLFALTDREAVSLCHQVCMIKYKKANQICKLTRVAIAFLFVGLGTGLLIASGVKGCLPFQ